jgi:hypothetical protein
MEPRKHPCRGADGVWLPEGSIGDVRKGEDQPAHRGLRARHADEGSPGTWEILSSPRISVKGATVNNLLAHGGCAPHSWERSSGHGAVPQGEGQPKQCGTDGGKSEHSNSTGEAGESIPRDPVEGRRVPGHGTVGGKDVENIAS